MSKIWIFNGMPTSSAPPEGAVFGLWTFISEERAGRWRVRCVCGTERTVRSQDVRRGRSQSCGCRGQGFKPHTAGAERRTTHGRDYGDKVYRAWRNAKDRTANCRAKKFPGYGARGISMCDEWFHSFPAFLAYVGEPPSTDHSLDRIDNDKGYEPGNVRWATAKEQVRNRRTTVRVTIRGVTRPLSEWCDEYGIAYNTAQERLKRGWPPEKAISRPVRPLSRKDTHASPK